VVQDARRVDHIERACFQAGLLEIGLHELHAIVKLEPLRRRRAETERGTRQIGADDEAIGARQI
jgi:hypothetical protein